MNIKIARALCNVRATVIANNSTASPIVLAAQPGGGHRVSVVVRNTGSVAIEFFYDRDTAPAGAGTPLAAGAAMGLGEAIAWPLAFSARSQTSGAGAITIDYVEISAA